MADCTEWYETPGGIVHRSIKGADVYLRMHIIQNLMVNSD
jgi:hypothetical protein